jgi:hypothetical protein
MRNTEKYRNVSLVLPILLLRTLNWGMCSINQHSTGRL